MTEIKHILIVYNPNSTGDSKKNADTLYNQLQVHTDINVTLQPTEYAGHGEKIAQELHKKSINKVMIVSSSGDGGYHEVINGILAGDKNKTIIAGLLPSGNANDHFHAIHHGDAVSRIIEGDIQSIDVLKVKVGNWTRYAHSYAGIGLTPHIGEKLTQATLNPFNEIWLTAKYFFNFNPTKVQIGSSVIRYNSLIFSNIHRMSKYLTLSKDAKIDDGKFEVTGSRAGTIGKLLGHLFKASTVGLTDDAKSVKSFSFIGMRPFALQLDGEVYHFKAGAKVDVTIEHKALQCII